MEIVKQRTYFGVNQYTDCAAAYFLLDLGDFYGLTLEELQNEFIVRLAQFIPAVSAILSVNRRDGQAAGQQTEFPKPVMAGMFEVVVRQLLCDVGENALFFEIKPAQNPGQVEIIYACSDQEVAQRAGELAFRLISMLLPAAETDGQFNFAADKQALFHFARSRGYPLMSRAIQSVAEECLIPVFKLNRWPLTAQLYLLFSPGCR